MSDWADEKAREVHRAITWRSCAESGGCIDMMARCYCLDEQRIIAAALRAALEAERAACWKIAENAADDDERGDSPYDNGAGRCGYGMACRDIAAAIAARKAP